MSEKFKRKMRKEGFLAKLLFVSVIIFVLSISTVFAQFARVTGDEGWGYGYGYGYGDGYGFDSGETAGFRTGGDDLDTYAYGYGYGYMLSAPSGGVYTVEPDNLASLATAGLVTAVGGDITSTTAITFTAPVTISTTMGDGTVTIVMPEGLTMTTSSAQDLSALAATNARNSVSVDNLDVRFGLQYGLPNATITLSEAVTITMPVGAYLNGETLNVYRSASATSGYTLLGTCVVSSATCSFSTTQLSYFAGGVASTTVATSGSGGGGGGVTPAATTSTVDMTVDANGGALVKTNADGGQMRLVVPTNAVSENTKFEMYVTTATGQGISLPTAASGWFLANNQMYSIESDDSLFGYPLDLELSYTNAQIAGLDEGSLKLFYWDVSKAKWIELSSVVDTTANKVTSKTQHLTVFALMGNKTSVSTDPEAVVGSTEGFIPAKPSTPNPAAEAESLSFFTELTNVVPNDDTWPVVHFIAYGTPESSKLSVRDRKGVVGDYYEIYSRVPSNAADWKDIALILTSHKPLQRNLKAEQKAIYDFAKVYKRLPNYSNINDEWAMYYIGYNVRNVLRNIDSEKAAINTFRSVYRYSPSTSHQWSIMRAIAYTGATR
jgi:hypothetical protein